MCGHLTFQSKNRLFLSSGESILNNGLNQSRYSVLETVRNMYMQQLATRKMSDPTSIMATRVGTRQHNTWVDFVAAVFAVLSVVCMALSLAH